MKRNAAWPEKGGHQWQKGQTHPKKELRTPNSKLFGESIQMLHGQQNRADTSSDTKGGQILRKTWEPLTVNCLGKSRGAGLGTGVGISKKPWFEHFTKRSWTVAQWPGWFMLAGYLMAGWLADRWLGGWSWNVWSRCAMSAMLPRFQPAHVPTHKRNNWWNLVHIWRKNHPACKEALRTIWMLCASIQIQVETQIAIFFYCSCVCQLCHSSSRSMTIMVREHVLNMFSNDSAMKFTRCKTQFEICIYV